VSSALEFRAAVLAAAPLIIPARERSAMRRILPLAAALPRFETSVTVSPPAPVR